MLVKGGAEVNVCLLDHVEEHFVHAGLLAVDERRVEEHLRGLEALHPDLD